MMYICFDACKKRFINGCRPVICLDAYHLKGEYGRHLLCAIGKDGNDGMFHITFAVAETETKESW
jgi:predicted secreted Zn-dependent protease